MQGRRSVIIDYTVRPILDYSVDLSERAPFLSRVPRPFGPGRQRVPRHHGVLALVPRVMPQPLGRLFMPGEFILICVPAISMTSCFVYRFADIRTTQTTNPSAVRAARAVTCGRV